MTENREQLDHIRHLIQDKKNRRKHTPRNVGMIADSLNKVGAGRSIVIDENNEILAGNATIEAAGEAGITKLRVVESSGDEIIAVRRTGMTADQKRDLAIYDNRTGDLAEWDVDQLLKDMENGIDLSPFFYDDELSNLMQTVEELEVPVSERLGDIDDAYVDFKCGDLGGKVSRDVYDSFVVAYNSHRDASGSAVLDDVVQKWLGLS
jgi:hypothetical protein